MSVNKERRSTTNYGPHGYDKIFSSSDSSDDDNMNTTIAKKQKPPVKKAQKQDIDSTASTSGPAKFVNQLNLQDIDAPAREYLDRDSEDDLRTIFCKSKCKSCKGCVCKRNGLACQKITGENQVGCECGVECTNCEGNVGSFDDWKTEKPINFGKQNDSTNETTTFGPCNGFENRNPFQLVQYALQKLNVLEEITRESNFYKMYREELAQKEKVDENNRQKNSRNIALSNNIDDESNVYTSAKEQENKERQNLESCKHNSRKSRRDVAKRKRKQEKRSQKGSGSNEPIEDFDIEEETKTSAQFIDWMAHKIMVEKIEENKVFTTSVIEKYLIITLVMGLVPITGDYELYWSKRSTDLGLYYNPMIRKIMSRKRFREIHKYIHFNVETFESQMNSLFKTMWKLSPNISIDEGLLGYRGRCKFLQFIPGKPERFGIKYFCLCDSIGFCYAFFIYKGSATQRATDSSGIVIEFVQELPKNEGPYVIYADNWYGNEALANHLNSMGIKFVLCCKGNRPSYLFNSGLTSQLSKKGDIVARYKESIDAEGRYLHPLIAMSFYDRKKCNFISNCYGAHITPISGDKKRPEMVHFYNLGMGGVDNFDYGIHSFALFPHRRNKFTRVVFFGLWKMLFVNLWYCYRYSKKQFQNTTQREFLLEIVKGYVDLWDLKKDVGFEAEFQHFTRKMAKNEKRAHCVVCRSNTAYMCRVCKKPIHPECMAKFCTKY